MRGREMQKKNPKNFESNLHKYAMNSEFDAIVLNTHFFSFCFVLLLLLLLLIHRNLLKSTGTHIEWYYCRVSINMSG